MKERGLFASLLKTFNSLQGSPKCLFAWTQGAAAVRARQGVCPQRLISTD